MYMFFHDISRVLIDSSAHRMAELELILYSYSDLWCELPGDIGKVDFVCIFCISFICFQLWYSFLQGCDRDLPSVNIINVQSYPITVQFQLNNNDSANGSCDYHLVNSDSANTSTLQVTNRDSGNTAFNFKLLNSISTSGTCNNQLTNGTSSNICSTFRLTNKNEVGTTCNIVLNQLLQTQYNDWIHRKRSCWIKNSIIHKKVQ